MIHRGRVGESTDLATFGGHHPRRLAESEFVSGRSTHADRLATIRQVFRRYGVMVDPHTADGIKVALEYRDRDVPVICIETALPAKFAETIYEALGRDPERPPELADLEQRPKRFTVMAADAAQVKRYIGEHCRD